MHPSTHCFCTLVNADREHATGRVIISDVPQISRCSLRGHGRAHRAAFPPPRFCSDTSQPCPLSPEQGSKWHQGAGPCTAPQPPWPLAHSPAGLQVSAPILTHRGAVSRLGWAGSALAGRSIGSSLPIQPCYQLLKPGFAPPPRHRSALNPPGMSSPSPPIPALTPSPPSCPPSSTLADTHTLIFLKQAGEQRLLPPSHARSRDHSPAALKPLIHSWHLSRDRKTHERRSR